MSEEIKRKRGRPKQEKPTRDRQLIVLLTRDELDELGRISRVVGESKSNFVRIAIDIRLKEIEHERRERFSYLSRSDDDYYDEYDYENDDDFY